ncbi:hypothetical protein RHMOL_Rhmol05G0176500 [Rhododendron molle]|uniref:Uncharacterized protein n=1 Tax=Rhododendron molle TaxID=49168 RepID=A0ACC0NRD4_RHOML|nr:hypothetical protein RHMOL_Rhmol05G0176500 [Rhododendron molle]
MDDDDDHHLQQPDKSILNPSSTASSPDSSPLRTLPSKSAIPKVPHNRRWSRQSSPNQAPRHHPTSRHLQPHLRPALGPNLRFLPPLPALRQGRPHPGHAQP